MQEACCYALANSSCILYPNGLKGRGKQVQEENHQQTSARGCFLLLHGHTMCVKNEVTSTLSIDSSSGQSPISKCEVQFTG